VDLGNLQVEREFNDVRMVCNAYLGLLKYGQVGEVYNVCSGQFYTLQQVMDTLAELSGHALQIRVNPVFVRVNEVLRLCGDPGKLRQLFAQSNHRLHAPDLRTTLQWMLTEAVP
jgi:GDP-D-mannose dehydratase